MKKVARCFVLILLLISILGNAALAATPETIEPNDSSYLSSYYASADSSTDSGTIKISFLVRSTKTNPTTIGVSKIVICRYDGTPMRTYYGSTSNNLLSSGVFSYAYTYTVTGLEPGTSYYAQVTVIAGDANGSDTRTVTTSTVKAGP